MAAYEVALLVVGVAIFGAAVLPRILERRAASFPMLYVTFGWLLFALVPGAPSVEPLEHSAVTERLTELVIIVSLMGAGLKLDRPFGLGRWSVTWRLLAVTLPLTAVSTALFGWGVLGMLPATALLLGAVLAPTDPVLAADVDAGAPLTELEEEGAPEHKWGTVRFALTSEAGFNDGLAFPLTNLAIAAAGASAAGGWAWLGEWAAVDVGYKIGVGLVFGYVVGNVVARLVFRVPATRHLADVMAGAEALAATLVAFAVTELAHGYGFIAVFVAALTLRRYEWEHDYYTELHDFAVVVERLLIAVVLVLFGGALASGLLAPLSVTGVVLGLVFLLFVRPLAGLLAFVGSQARLPERLVVSFFGIRGIGSFYYLSYALSQSSFTELELLVAADELWAIVGFVTVASIAIHGTTATPVMEAFEEWRSRRLSSEASGDT